MLIVSLMSKVDTWQKQSLLKNMVVRKTHSSNRDIGPVGQGQVRVRHKFAGLNFIDIYQRSGLYQLPLRRRRLAWKALALLKRWVKASPI